MARKKTTKAANTTDLAEPQNRTEEFLANIAGLVNTLPEGEFSRLERYLKYIAENGGGGGVTSFNSRTGAVVPQSADYASFYAPSGYGWGDCRSFTFASDSEFKTWFAANAIPKTNRNTFAASVWITGVHTARMLMIASSDTGTGIADTTIICYGYDGTVLRRYINSLGVWQDWEYENPPLIAGTEYRTTERYLGKPVYAQAVSLLIPASTGVHRITEISADDVDKVVSTRGVMNGTFSDSPFVWSIPYDDATNIIRLAVYYNTTTGLCAYFRYDGSLVPTSATCVVKYTKTTD